MNLADVRFTNHGSICIMYPCTPDGYLWVDEHVDTEDAQAWGQNGIVVENRYVGPIMDAISADGLAVEYVG